MESFELFVEQRALFERSDFPTYIVLHCGETCDRNVRCGARKRHMMKMHMFPEIPVTFTIYFNVSIHVCINNINIYNEHVTGTRMVIWINSFYLRTRQQNVHII